MASDRDIAILVVDDDAAMRGVVRKLLEQLGFHRIEEAVDGLEALEKLRHGHFGLVISDWNMEPMDGLDLLRDIRSDSALGAIPMILATGETNPRKAAAAAAAGASAYLVKPFDRQILGAALERIFGPFGSVSV